MARYASRVQVYDSNIAAMHRPGGEVFAEARKILRRTKTVATALAPIRSGELKRRHRISGPINSGIYGVRGYVENTSGHALYVHEGTTGPITSKRSSSSRAMGLGRGPARMRVRAGNGYPEHYAISVRGQAAQPWLREAANTVLSRYGVRVGDGIVRGGSVDHRL